MPRGSQLPMEGKAGAASAAAAGAAGAAAGSWRWGAMPEGGRQEVSCDIRCDDLTKVCVSVCLCECHVYCMCDYMVSCVMCTVSL